MHDATQGVPAIMRSQRSSIGSTLTAQLDRLEADGLVELYARSSEEATGVLEEAARGQLTITSLAEESRPPAATGGEHPH